MNIRVPLALFYFLCPMLALAAEEQVRTLESQNLPDLPVAISNNAVALVADDDAVSIYSFLGLETGKAWSDTSSIAMKLTADGDVADGVWQVIAPVPGEDGRLAAHFMIQLLLNRRQFSI